MHIKSNNRGITLVELLIAVSLLMVVLSSAYYILSFSMRSMNYTEAQYIAGQDARMVAARFEEDIRKSQTVTIGAIKYKAVTVMDSGMKINVYTDVGNDGSIQLVEYKLENNQLLRGETNLGITPPTTVWKTIAYRVKNNLLATPTPIFSVSNELVTINLLVLDEKNQLFDSPISVSTSISVRSKGAME